jgi:predicted nucleic acid-binding protein
MPAFLYKVQWTDDILEEVQRNLIKKIGLSENSVRRLIDIMKETFPEALITQHSSIVEVMRNDPKDRHVLAAAVVSRSQVIVTQNLRHFPLDILAPFEIEAQSPDDFLTHLFHLAPERMTSIIVKQAQDLRNPPKSVAEVIDILTQHVPVFARLVRKELENSST